MLFVQLFTWNAAGEKTSITTGNGRIMQVLKSKLYSALEKASLHYFSDK